MKNINLERFILENREQFDTATPRENLWTAIDQALSTPQDLEQFFVSNREAFDFAEPSNSLWTKINKHLGKADDCETVEAFISVRREAFNTAVPSDKIWMGIEKALHQRQQATSLETFIISNRAAFDEATPSASIWSAVDKTLRPQEKQQTVRIVNIRRILSIAASVLLLLTVGAAAGVYFTKSQANTNSVASLAAISPEYAEMVRYYDAQINQKAKQVSLESNDKSVLEDLKMVDKAMAELEAELQKAPKGAEEQIVANLVKSYQIKLEILERVLERIQSKQENSTKQNKKDDEVNI